MLTKKDYLLVGFIGLFFAIFSLPILNNIKLGFFEINFQNSLFLIIFFVILAVVALYFASLISKKIPVVLQVAKFSAVGAFNTFLDWGVLNMLIALSGIAGGVSFAIFKAISFLVSNGGSYFWNKYWTFKSDNQANTKEVLKFFVVSVGGLVINVFIASLVVSYIKPLFGFSQERWANVGALVATLASLVWNFIGYKFIVFVSRNKNSQTV